LVTAGSQNAEASFSSRLKIQIQIQDRFGSLREKDELPTTDGPWTKLINYHWAVHRFHSSLLHLLPYFTYLIFLLLLLRLLLSLQS